MKALTMMCAAVLCVCWAAFAYPGDTITVHFANPVVVNDTTIPAGDVTITVQRSNPSVTLTFRSDSGVIVNAVATRINDYDETRPETTVVLGKQGNALRVERIWLPEHTGFAITQ